MKLRITILLAIVCSLALAFTASAKNVKPGKWQLTVETSIPNSPVKPGPMSFTKCITKEEAESNEPPKSSRDNDCKISDLKMEGNTASWKVSCEKRGITGEGTATYSGDSYTSSMTMHMQGQDISTKSTGKYLGDCDK